MPPSLASVSQSLALHATFGALLAVRPTVASWREPSELAKAIAETGKLMLGKRQLGGWTGAECAALVAALSPKGLELYRRYTSLTPSVVFTTHMSLMLAVGMRAFTWVPSVACTIPLTFFSLNVAQDFCVSVAISDVSSSMRAFLAPVTSWITRCKFSTLIVAMLAAPTTLGPFLFLGLVKPMLK